MADTKKITIDLERLRFDQNNPRLPVRLQGVTDEKQIIDYMVKYGNITELMMSIAETGYSDAEPLLAVGEEDGSYTVVEGNRRLTALKLLNAPELTKVRQQSVREIVSGAKHIPGAVPVILYEKREDILDYLGYRHITGVKDWGALEKARYLDQLYQAHVEEAGPDKIYTKLAKMIGSRADYVASLHAALKLYDKANDNAYYGADIKEDDIHFSLLTTALGHKRIKRFLGLRAEYNTEDNSSLSGLKEENYRKLFTWMFYPGKEVIHESRQISDLAKVLEIPEATSRLERGGSLEEALLYTSAPSEAFVHMLDNARRQLRQAKEAIEQLQEEPPEAEELLEDIEKLARTIRGGLAANYNKEQERPDFLEELAADPKMVERLELLEQLLRHKN